MGRVMSRCCMALHDLYEVGQKMTSTVYAKGFYIDKRRPADKNDKVIIPRGVLHYNVSGAFTKQDQYFLYPPRYSEIIILTDKKKSSLYKISEEMEDYIIELSDQKRFENLLTQFIDWQDRIKNVIPRCSPLIKRKTRYWLEQTCDIVEYLIENHKQIETDKDCELIQDILFDLAGELSV